VLVWLPELEPGATNLWPSELVSWSLWGNVTKQARLGLLLSSTPQSRSEAAAWLSCMTVLFKAHVFGTIARRLQVHAGQQVS